MVNQRIRVYRLTLLLVLVFVASVSRAGGRDYPGDGNHVRYFPHFARVPSTFYTTGAEFEALPIDLDDSHLFDIGIADFNADGALDIYTANHSARQSFLENDGTGGFPANEISAYGFDQSSDFPGLEDSLDSPLFSEPGLYIYWHDSIMIFRAYNWPDATEVTGSATFIPTVDVVANGGLDFELTYEPLPGDNQQTTVSFSVSGNGEMQITPLPRPSVGSPINFSFAPQTNPAQLFVGISKINPSGHEFLLHLKDRHGLAWADYNRDGLPDVYMSRGGNRGDSEIYPLELIIDQFYVSNNGSHEQVATDSLGFVKDGCATRQAAWTDFNGDDRIDLYLVCARADPNQLYRQNANGSFSNVAADYGLALHDDGDFVWLDADGDGDMDLFWAGTQAYLLLVNQGATFVREEVAIPDGRATKLTVGDYDGDGDGDIFAASSGQSWLFRNHNGALQTIAPQSLGLPTTALAANWVDYDNDGLLDLHVVPHGLFRQLPGSTFIETGVLKLESGAAEPVEARASWFDADGDGKRDLIVSTYLRETDQNGDTQSWWFTRYFRNQNSSDHRWLAVELEGAGTNREAIGASVAVEFDGRSVEQQIGWSEGARFSYGHYRLYFGLEDAVEVDRVTVTWPDGSTHSVDNVMTNQLLTIQFMEP